MNTVGRSRINPTPPTAPASEASEASEAPESQASSASEEPTGDAQAAANPRKLQVAPGTTGLDIARADLERRIRDHSAEYPRYAKVAERLGDGKPTPLEERMVRAHWDSLLEENPNLGGQLPANAVLNSPEEFSPEVYQAMADYEQYLDLASQPTAFQVEAGDTVTALAEKGLGEIVPPLADLPPDTQRALLTQFTREFVAQNGIQDPNAIRAGQTVVRPEVSPDLADEILQAVAAHQLKTGAGTKDRLAKLHPEAQGRVARQAAHMALKKVGQSAADFVNKGTLAAALVDSGVPLFPVDWENLGANFRGYV